MADLITLEEYKDYAGITSPTEDIKISLLVPAVSDLIKSYCSRRFNDYVDTDKVELFTIRGTQDLVILDEFPVISITSVEERSSYGSDYVALVDTDFDYYFDPELDAICRTTPSGPRFWSKGPASVKVTYRAGYETLPQDLVLAAYDLVTYYLKNEYRGYKMLNGAATNTPGSTGQKGNVTFPDHIKRVLDLYKTQI